jgi:hypothetical protein
MLVDVCLHSASAALHYYQGSSSAAPVPVTHVSHSQSVLAPTSASVTVEP